MFDHILSTASFVKNTPLRVVFSTRFSVFGNEVRHGRSCFIYFFRNQCGTPRKWVTKTGPKWPGLRWRNRYRVKANQIFNTGLAFSPLWSRKRKRVDDIAESFGASLTPNTPNTGYAGWSRISWGSVYPWGPDEVFFAFGFNLKIELNRWKEN